jgi:hypothetical protein
VRSPFDEAGTLAASCRSNCAFPTRCSAAKVAEEARRLNVDAVFVDATGMGWGVFDRLKLLGVPDVFSIEFSRSPDRVNFDDPIWSLPRSRSRSCVRDDLMPNRRLPVDKCRHFPDCPRLRGRSHCCGSWGTAGG